MFNLVSKPTVISSTKSFFIFCDKKKIRAECIIGNYERREESLVDQHVNENKQIVM